MPLGWERLNVKQTTPNKNIVFIKPLPGSTQKTSQDFLERIAAQCLPVMNKHCLAVVSLEEYEYNTEFLGRNFNNGEVIQLVLKSASGNWLPFNFVQMVMMHELAHNKQMNHSKAFWAVRNEFASEMKDLWKKNYTGDGLWGRGVLLENGLFTHGLDKDEPIPEHMCGGTFKSRADKKRKAKPRITYKEQKERRIRKKFGENGLTLGACEETKVKLERGKKPAGKPRVAGSVRGRDLRAAAALARFEREKEEPQIKDEEMVTDSEAEGDMDGGVKTKAEPDEALDIDGSRLTDRNGHGMVKVCEGEVNDNDDANNELLDLYIVPGHSQRYLSSPSFKNSGSASGATSSEPSRVSGKELEHFKGTSEPSNIITPVSNSSGEAADPQLCRSKILRDNASDSKPSSYTTGQSLSAGPNCPICSVVNDQMALTCAVCANVLQPEFVANTWHCQSLKCGLYLNAGDVNLCGICGTRKEVL